MHSSLLLVLDLEIPVHHVAATAPTNSKLTKGSKTTSYR